MRDVEDDLNVVVARVRARRDAYPAGCEVHSVLTRLIEEIESVRESSR